MMILLQLDHVNGVYGFISTSTSLIKAKLYRKRDQHEMTLLEGYDGTTITTSCD